MASQNTLVSYAESKSCSQDTKKAIVFLIENGIITSEDVIDKCAQDKDFLFGLLEAYAKAKFPTKCPECGGKLERVGTDQYRCRWCGAGIGVGGTGAPMPYAIGTDAGTAMLKALVVLAVILIIIIVAIYFVLKHFNILF